MKKIFTKPTEKEITEMRASLIAMGILLIFTGCLLMYDTFVRQPQAEIKTATGFLQPCYSVYHRRRGFDLYVVVDGVEYVVDEDDFEQPGKPLEDELNRMVTCGAEVTYIEGPDLKPHLLGLKVLGEEYISFDEVYQNWQKNNDITNIIGPLCLLFGPLCFLPAWRMGKRKPEDE